MHTQIIKLCTIIVCVLTILCNSYSNKKRLLDYLMEHIKLSQVYQVLIIGDQDKRNTDYDVDNIIKRIVKVIPTREIAFQEATEQKIINLTIIPSFYNPRATTLIVVIDASVGEQLLTSFREPINFFTKLSKARSRPKCLFIFLEEHKKSTYEELLQQMWSNRYLDATLLEINRKERAENGSAKIYNFNPFTKTLKSEVYKLKSNLFPDKSRNLHGYPIKTDVFNRPPVAYVTRNLTGHVENVFGSDVTIILILSKAMNCRILWIPSNDTFWKSVGCTENENTGVLYRLMHNKVQLFAARAGRSASCLDRFIEWSVSTKMISFIIVVPTCHNEFTKVSSELRLSNILIIISFLLLSWILTQIMHFNQHSWRFPHLIQIMFGLTAPLEPRRLVERIVLGSLLLTCLLNSTFVYTSFAEMILLKESEQTLETIYDVTVSRFQPVVNSVVKFYLYNFTEGSSRLLLDKATVMDISPQECLSQLIQNKNIACIVPDDVAQMTVQSNRDEFGKPSLAIVKEYVWSAGCSFLLEAASPFLSRINDILLRLCESGVLEKVQGNYYGASVAIGDAQDVDEVEKTESIQIRREVTLLLFGGYLCSFFVFLCEVLASIFYKRSRPERLVIE